jgi:sugar phosphate isomerase/epimerase
MQIGSYARHQEQLKDLLKYEPDFVELRLDINHTIKLSEARRLFTDAGISCTLHMPSSPEWSPTDIGREIIPYIDRAAEVEAQLVVVHGSLSSLFYSDEEIDEFINALPLACDAAEETGIRLAIETLGTLYTEMAVMFETCDVDIALDIGHGQIMALRNRAMDLLNAFPERVSLVNVHDNNGSDMIKEVANLKKKKNISKHDIRDLAVRYDTHLPTIQFEKIFSKFKDNQYDGRFLLLSNNPDDFPKEREKFLKLWENS